MSEKSTSIVEQAPIPIPVRATEEEKRERKQKEALQKENEKAMKEAEKMLAAENRHKAAEAEHMQKAEEKKQKIHEIKEQENNVMATIAAAVKKGGYRDLVSNAYTALDANTEMAIKGFNYGFIGVGRGGVGKTFRILQKCILECGRENIAYTDSYTTAGGFAVWLFQNREKEVIILDDVAGLLSNPKIVAMLKGALWHTSDGKTRVVNYMTTKPLQDEYGEPVPSTFEIDARIIIITNELNDDNPHIKAILSRVNVINVEIPYSELISLLEQIVDKTEYKELSKAERREGLDFLKKNTTRSTADLNIRTLLKIFDYFAYAKNVETPDLWKVLSLDMLQQNDRLVLVEKLMQDKSLLSETERVEKFTELTGGSKNMWYRLRKKYEKQHSDGEGGDKSFVPTAKTVAQRAQ